MKFRFKIALLISKLIVTLMNLFHVRGGSDISGKIAIKICPDFIKYIRGIDYSKTVLITGTNGKSSTTTMVSKILTGAGKEIATNKEGANLLTGAATVLIKNCSWGGVFNKEFLILESDERFLGRIFSFIPAKYLGITNIQKDQVQRNGTPEFIYNKIKPVVEKVDTVFLNGDEPNSLSLRRFANNVVIYSVDENSKTYKKDGDDVVTTACYYCGNPTVFDSYNLDKVGKFHCSTCDFGHDTGDYRVENVDFDKETFSVGGNTFTMKLHQEYFLYCYAMAVAITSRLGLRPEEIEPGLAKYENVGGRVEDLLYKYENGHEALVHYLKFKQENPETLQSALDAVAVDTNKKTVVIWADLVKDFVPFYNNMLYLYDVDYSKLAGSSHFIVFGKVDAAGTARALELSGIDPETIDIVEEGDLNKLFGFIEENTPEGQPIYLVVRSGIYDNIMASLGDKIRRK